MLAIMLAACAFGVLATISLGLDLGVLPFLVGLGLIVWFGYIDAREVTKRVIVLIAFGTRFSICCWFVV